MWIGYLSPVISYMYLLIRNTRCIPKLHIGNRQLVEQLDFTGVGFACDKRILIDSYINSYTVNQNKFYSNTCSTI